MNPRIKYVTPTEDYKLKLIFSNDEQGIYDCSDLLDFGWTKGVRGDGRTPLDGWGMHA